MSRPDFTEIASALAALIEIPGRLAALELEQAKTRSELQALRAAQPPLLCSVAEAATRLKVSIPTIRRRIKAGELPTVRIGNSIRVDLTHIHGVDAAGVAKLAEAARRPTLAVVNDAATPLPPGKRSGTVES